MGKGRLQKNLTAQEIRVKKWRNAPPKGHHASLFIGTQQKMPIGFVLLWLVSGWVFRELCLSF